MGEVLPSFVEVEPTVEFVSCDLVRISGPDAQGGTWTHVVPRLVHYAHVRKWLALHEEYMRELDRNGAELVRFKRKKPRHD